MTDCRTLVGEDCVVLGKEVDRVSALVWWLIPIAITATAIVVVSLRTRMGDPRTDPMTERMRLREAMERPGPLPRSSRGRTHR
jgi:hypothetical protein